ncbi:hypothetical protein ACFSMW_16760 [Virgibacillus halophilus]|uniref:TOBE domain-containing protein n=1 Tax=Tigheibacillus halophilus TaxID=361280 RepID=A0ABU5C3C6_9BACI|nr:TOBE domain-containing protein [Virgibacillus halophilus]
MKNVLEYPFQKNDVVNFVVKPEFWSISDQGSFLVEINQATFLGSHVEYVAQIGEQSFKFFDYHYYENGQIETGSEVRLKLRSDLVKVLQHNT